MSEPIGVLHVDDEPDFAEVTADFLEREDDRLEVGTETRVSDGLDRLAAEDFACVVSDYDMPGMDGLAFLERVRDNFDDLPFILFTGKGSEEVASEAFSAGATDYLQKEVGTDQYTILANRIVNSVETARAKRQRQRQLDALETAQDGISILDDDGQFIYVNEAYADLYGYEPEDMIGEHWALIYPDEEVHFVRTEILPTVTDGGEWRGETTGLRADGSTFVEDHTLATADNGELICTVRDITDRKEREQELQQERAFTKNVLDTLPDLFYAVDDSGEFLRWNERLAEVTGYSDEEIAAMHPTDFFADDDVERVAAVIDRTLTEGHATVEADVVTKSGEPIPYELSASRMTDEDGAVVGIGRDISERKEREHHLERYETIVELAADLVYVLDAEGRLTFVNENTMMGYTPDELVGEHVSAVMTEDDITEGEGVIRNLLGNDDRQHATFEMDLITEDGEAIPCENHIALLRDDEGFAGTIGVLRDISTRKERERQLHTLHEATHEMLAAATRQEVADIASAAGDDILDIPVNIHLYEADADGLVPVAVSPKTQAVLGDPPTIQAGEGIAWRVFDSADPEIYDDVRTAPGVFNPETAIRSECCLPLGGHGVLLAASTTVGAFDESDISLLKILAATVETAFDRARREQELRTRERELQRQNDRLDEFASVVSHDLRNPLNVAQGHLELAEETGDAEHFEAIARAQNRMEGIIEDVLTLAQLGDAVGETRSIALDEVARRAWDNVETGTTTLQIDVGRTTDGDASRLTQLFENLFRNAIDHGGEDVTVSVDWLEERAGFYVEDTGPGIPSEERARIFESGYTTESEGTGFGLAIVTEIVDGHGWEIDVTRGEEGGARFEITIE